MKQNALGIDRNSPAFIGLNHTSISQILLAWIDLWFCHPWRPCANIASTCGLPAAVGQGRQAYCSKSSFSILHSLYTCWYLSELDPRLINSDETWGTEVHNLISFSSQPFPFRTHPKPFPLLSLQLKKLLLAPANTQLNYNECSGLSTHNHANHANHRIRTSPVVVKVQCNTYQDGFK